MDRIWAYCILFDSTGIVIGDTYEEALTSLQEIHNLHGKSFILREVTERNYQELDYFFDYDIIHGNVDHL